MDSVRRVDEVVITGTKTAKRKTESPILVNVLNGKVLKQLNSCSVTDGARFQPGLRVESNCQTCNYTQLRINGLMGGYSQVLINGRPIFSPITGLYGLEQIPTEQISRLEVIRGGGSSLYGSSAIGGTVNIILKEPRKTSFSVGQKFQYLGNSSKDLITYIESQWVSKKKNFGFAFQGNYRSRDHLDINGDGFSELPNINQWAIGLNSFWDIAKQHSIKWNVSNLNEYRHGGDMANLDANSSRQSEERKQDVWMSTLDYRFAIKPEISVLSVYSAAQYTVREHFTGIQPNDPLELENYKRNLPFGNSEVSSFQIGAQWDRRHEGALGKHILTLGVENLIDDVRDEIKAYNYLIDQASVNYGMFVQSDWSFNPFWTILSGVRFDRHNFLPKDRLSPRIALLHKRDKNSQFRLSYGTGFRAPQAFDTDMHIAFAGGGVSRISLSPSLLPETSSSWGFSWNYDKPTVNHVFGFTVDLFHTYLKNAFYLNSVGEDNFGERFLKVNGEGARVQGVTLEGRVNVYGALQMEGGFTLQQSLYNQPVTWVEGAQAQRSFIRTPNSYGYASIGYFKSPKITFNINYVYTGAMLVPHFAGSPEQETDEIKKTKAFHELGFTFFRKISIRSYGSFELTAGMKNVLNSFQSDFDSGKNRDSNYVYGPIQPRTVSIGLRLTLN